MDPTLIENPEKIGIGFYAKADGMEILSDLDLIRTNWFYSWSPALAPLGVGEWGIGDAVTISGTAGDAALALGAGSEAWAWQTYSLNAGAFVLLSFDAASSSGGTGAVVVQFLDAGGHVLGSKSASVSGGDKVYSASMIAPAGTVSASLIAYTVSGTGIVIDDVSLKIGGNELVHNGGFESYTDSSDYMNGFTPMIWGASDMQYARTPGYFGSETTLLTFNEPDVDSQSNLSVAQALSYWPDLMATGMRLGSPAVTAEHALGQGSWLQSFMSQADALGDRVDFIAVHYYSTDPSIDAFKSFLQALYDAYHRPVWVTEWALADWNNPGRFTADQQQAFFAAATQMMDDLPFVERQAWFGIYEGMDGWNLHSGLIDANGNLTIVGAAFADLADPHVELAPSDLLLASNWIAENSKTGASIGFVTAIDGTAHDSFTYALLDDAGGRFAIDAATGELTVLDGRLLDYEQANSFAIAVKVTDGAGHVFSKQLTIDLTNVEESQSLTGTIANDTLCATSGDCWNVSGLAGNDLIETLDGADSIRGGAGNDAISAGGGNDLVEVSGKSDGFDSVDGGAGSDRIVALANGTVIGLADLSNVEAISANGFTGVTISGSGGADTLDFSEVTLTGITRIIGGAGNDVIVGSAGDDFIDGGAGTNMLSGAAGNDRFVAGAPSAVDGGNGYDVIVATGASQRIWLTSLSGVEEISSGGFTGVTLNLAAPTTLDLSAVTLTGITRIIGSPGADIITGSGGNDVMSGGSGSGDALHGGAGADTFQFSKASGADLLDGGDGFDTAAAVENGSVLGWGAVSSVEKISGAGFTDVAIGGTAGDDVIDLSGILLENIARIAGGGGNDRIIGGAGGDTLVGGSGSDLLWGGTGADRFVYSSIIDSRTSSGVDVIEDFQDAIDRIDLSAIDASTKLTGNQAFSFLGSSAFSKVAGQLRLDTSDASKTVLLGDTNGDGSADIRIELIGTHSLTSADFQL